MEWCHTIFLKTNMYYLYILKCADDTLYTGITTDITRRVAEHNTGKKGAKYTQSRRPVSVVFSKKYKNRSKASQEEAKIKKLTRTQKMALLSTLA